MLCTERKGTQTNYLGLPLQLQSKALKYKLYPEWSDGEAGNLVSRIDSKGEKRNQRSEVFHFHSTGDKADGDLIKVRAPKEDCAMRIFIVSQSFA
jgi:hypothetical protein